jgi:hypothetical protein
LVSAEENEALLRSYVSAVWNSGNPDAAEQYLAPDFRRDDSGQLAAAFGFGTPTGDLTPVARGEQGTVWRLDTDRGSFAIKEPFEPQTEADATADVAYQEAVQAGSQVWLSAGGGGRSPGPSL